MFDMSARVTCYVYSLQSTVALPIEGLLNIKKVVTTMNVALHYGFEYYIRTFFFSERRLMFFFFNAIQK